MDKLAAGDPPALLINTWVPELAAERVMAAAELLPIVLPLISITLNTAPVFRMAL